MDAHFPPCCSIGLPQENVVLKEMPPGKVVLKMKVMSKGACKETVWSRKFPTEEAETKLKNGSHRGIDQSDKFASLTACNSERKCWTGYSQNFKGQDKNVIDAVNF